MDLLAKRYASPFFVLEEYVRQGRVCEFVIEVNEIHNDEQLWELWLHKVFEEKSFDEWKKSLRIKNEPPVDKSTLKETVTNSKIMLDGFVPE